MRYRNISSKSTLDLQLKVESLMLKEKKYIVILLMGLMLVSCGVKKKAVSNQPSEVSVPTWHTCLIQNARATVTIHGEKVSASVTMQTVRDSMSVISVMPLGMEVIRFEATPLEMIGINKLDGTYATATYADINRRLVPTINWDVIQQLCTAELPTGDEKAHLQYMLGDQPIEMIITYPKRKLDVPVRVTHQNVSRYNKIDITKWL